MKLYRAYSTADNYHGMNGVPFTWYVIERPRPLPLAYEDMIKDFWTMDEDARLYTQDFLQESFTKEEVDQLGAYLLKAYNDDTFKAVEIEIPTEEFYPTGGIAVGGDTDFYMLTMDKEYNLPFKAWGYYDLRGGIPVLRDHNTAAFVQALLESMGVEAPENTKAATRSIYEFTGLYASKYASHKEERLIDLKAQYRGMLFVEATEDPGHMTITRGEEIAEEEALKEVIAESDTLEDLFGENEPDKLQFYQWARDGFAFVELALYKLGIKFSENELYRHIEQAAEKTGLYITRSEE